MLFAVVSYAVVRNSCHVIAANIVISFVPELERGLIPDSEFSANFSSSG